MASSYRHILRGTGLLGAVQLLQVALGVARAKAAALLVGPAGVGLADLLQRSADTLSGATGLGLGMSGVQRLSRLLATGRRREAAAFAVQLRSMALGTAALGALATLIAAPALSWSVTGSLGRAPQFALVAPAVAAMALLSAEATLLKAARRLRALALCSLGSAAAGVALVAALYWRLGLGGVAPALALSTAAAFGLHLAANLGRWPYRVRLGRLPRSGRRLARLGTAYVGAGLAGSLAELAVRAAVTWRGGEAAAGLYAAGFTLSVAYARLVFVAMDADYYPRLSAAAARDAHGPEIDRQTDVLTLVTAPLAAAFALLAPRLVPLLYSADFLPAAAMALTAAAAMYLKAGYLPLSYLALARADGRTFLLMELVYDAAMVALTAGLYLALGLAGAGLGLTLAGLLDWLLVRRVYCRRYAYRPSPATTRRFLAGLALVAAAVCAALSGATEAGVAVCAAAALRSALVFRRLDRGKKDRPSV